MKLIQILDEYEENMFYYNIGIYSEKFFIEVGLI